MNQTHKLSLLLIAMALATAWPPAAGVADAGPVLIRLQIWRVRGNMIASDLPAPAGRAAAGVADPELPFHLGRTGFRVLSSQAVSVDNHQLLMNSDGWMINGAPLPFKVDPKAIDALKPALELVASPSVLSNFGTTATMTIGSNQALEYFVRRSDGLYELQKLDTPVGMTIKILAEPGEGGRVHFSKIGFSLRAVRDRQPLEGTSLEVGPPVLSAVGWETDLSVRPGKDYAIIGAPPDGPLIIRLRADTGAAAAAGVGAMAQPTPQQPKLSASLLEKVTRLMRCAGRRPASASGPARRAARRVKYIQLLSMEISFFIDIPPSSPIIPPRVLPRKTEVSFPR